MFRFLIALALVSATSIALAAGEIAVVSEMFVETTTVEAGKVKTVLVKQGSGPPGTKLVFAHRYRNTSKAPVANFGMTNPIPAGIDYAGTDDASASVSVDGGKTWGALVALKVRGPNASLRAARFDEYGPRSFADYGLSQSLPLGKRWTVDFSLDGSKTLGGIDPRRVLNEEQPVATGGLIGTDGTLTEDFVAVTAGGSYHGDRWSWTGRAEYRAGDRTDRFGVITSALRQLGEGQALGGTFSWFRAEEKAGPKTEATALAVSWAHRPDNSRFAFLEKLELRSDIVRGGVLGLPGPIGGAPLLISGDATSRRIVNSFSMNWSPTEQSEGRTLGRSEFALFWGSRYVFDRVGADDIKGWSNIVGLDARWDLSQTLDVGMSGTVRESAGGRALAYSGGPAIGVSPFKGGYIQVGYNVLGFSDADYNDARYTRKGPFVTLRFKFDQTTFAGMGLGKR